MRTEMRLSNAAMLSVLVDSAVACLLQVPSAIDERMAALFGGRTAAFSSAAHHRPRTLISWCICRRGGVLNE